MIQLLQIFNHMLKTLEYTSEEVTELFEEVESGDTPLETFLYNIGVEPTENQLGYIRKSFPKWRSALHITNMKIN